VNSKTGIRGKRKDMLIPCIRGGSRNRDVISLSFQSDDPAFAGEMRMTWSLSPAVGGTEVWIIAENVPPGISKESHDVGLRSTLENLARFVE
jgi:hypothetical protein